MWLCNNKNLTCELANIDIEHVNSTIAGQLSMISLSQALRQECLSKGEEGHFPKGLNHYCKQNNQEICRNQMTCR